MVIDANVYWFPERAFSDAQYRERMFADVPRAYGMRAVMKERGGKNCIVVEKPVGCPGVDFFEGDYTLCAMLDALDEGNIDQAVMKVPCVHEWLSMDLCRDFNDQMADFAARSGGRLIALGVVPPFAGQAATDEIRRCMDDLHMHGMQLCAHYGQMYLDDEAFAPIFEVLNEYHATAYVHHTPVPTEYGAIAAYTNLRRSLGRCEDQLTAVGRELFSGLFEKYPHVKLVHSMLGGAFFAFQEMLMPHGAPDTTGRFAATPQTMCRALKNNLFFEMSHAQPWGETLLKAAVDILGADHIVYGSSSPVKAVWRNEGAAFVRALPVSEQDKQRMLCGNAQMLYHID